MSKSNTSAQQSAPVTDHAVAIQSIPDTSKKIRYLLSQGMSVKEVYNFLKGKVTTKAGGEIRYQHVRNVAMTKLSGE